MSLRLTWHPLTVAAALILAAGASMIAGSPVAGWLMLGTAAGFATSGST